MPLAFHVQLCLNGDSNTGNGVLTAPIVGFTGGNSRSSSSSSHLLLDTTIKSTLSHSIGRRGASICFIDTASTDLHLTFHHLRLGFIMTYSIILNLGLDILLANMHFWLNMQLLIRGSELYCLR